MMHDELSLESRVEGQMERKRNERKECRGSLYLSKKQQVKEETQISPVATWTRCNDVRRSISHRSIYPAFLILNLNLNLFPHFSLSRSIYILVLILILVSLTTDDSLLPFEPSEFCTEMRNLEKLLSYTEFNFFTKHVHYKK